MNRPLVVTDCDEVLLHMVRHFRDWLGEGHDIEFALEGDAWFKSMRRRGSDEQIAEAEIWSLLGSFFDTEMDRQDPIGGSIHAIRELQREADVVVLTNLVDARNEARRRQLETLGITARVYTNQGLKGAALSRIVEEHSAERIVFVDDIAKHHESAMETIPHVHRLHFVGEPAIAPHVTCAHQAGHAHARIDNWAEALPWIMETLHGDEK
jgi:hypothetical protein